MRAISGVYAVGLPSGKIYIGSSQNIQQRFSGHRTAIKNCSGRVAHANPQIRSESLTHKVEDFSFYVLEPCELECLRAREQFHIDAWRESGLLANANPKGVSHAGMRCHPDHVKKRAATNIANHAKRLAIEEAAP